MVSLLFIFYVAETFCVSHQIFFKNSYIGNAGSQSIRPGLHWHSASKFQRIFREIFGRIEEFIFLHFLKMLNRYGEELFFNEYIVYRIYIL